MSNLARKIQQREYQTVAPKTVERQVKRKAPLLSPGEKLIGVGMAIGVCVLAINIVSNQAAIYELNKGIQETEVAIQEQVKVNSDLNVQVSELSTYERIWAKAKELGLMLNENNVKVVQGE